MTTNLSESISKLEAKQRQYLNQRKNILKSLTVIRKNERFFKNQTQYPYHIQENEDKIRKLRKLNSETLPKNNQSLPSDSHLVAADSKKQLQSAQKIQEAEIKPQIPQLIKERNKRMVGALTKHLQSAKVDLVKRQEEIKKKVDIENKVAEKLVEQTKNLHEEKKVSLAKKKQQELKKKAEVSQQLLKLENTILETRYSQYISTLKGFIPTKTQPSIYWKPAKENDQLKKLLSQTPARLKVQEESVIKLIRSINQPIQYSKILVENQAEYLSNKINKYYKSLYGNIVTDICPPILWKPVKFNESLRALEQKSAAWINERKSKIEIKKQKPKQSSDEQVSQSDAQHSVHEQSK